MALALAGSVQVPASTGLLPPGSIIPTDSQRSTARKIGRILEDQHYSRAAIDDKLSDVVYQRYLEFFFFSSRRRHTSCGRDWSSDVCSSDLFFQKSLPENSAVISIFSHYYWVFSCIGANVLAGVCCANLRNIFLSNAHHQNWHGMQDRKSVV